MSVPKEPRARPDNEEESIGLMAIGSSGPWEIAIDQTISGPDRWFAQIEGPSVYFYFEIPSLEIIDDAIELLARGESATNGAQTARDDTLTLGTNQSTQVNLVRDDEFDDRFFLVIEQKNGLLIRFTVTGEDLTHVMNALRQAKEDLGDDNERPAQITA